MNFIVTTQDIEKLIQKVPNLTDSEKAEEIDRLNNVESLSIITTVSGLDIIYADGHTTHLEGVTGLQLLKINRF